MRYVWASDEELRIRAMTPEWRMQQTVTLHFHEIVCSDTVGSIFDRLLASGRLDRRIRERLSAAGMVTLVVDQDSGDVTGPDDAFQFVTELGCSLVSLGNPKIVLNKLRLLTPEQADDPKVCLVRGYAHIYCGQYFDARGAIAAADRNSSRLNTAESHLLNSLRNACDLQTGRINYQQYENRESKLADVAPPEFRWYHRLDVARRRHLAEHDEQLRHERLQALLRVADEVLNSDAPTAAKLKARIVRNYADWGDQRLVFFDMVWTLKSRAAMGQPPADRAWLAAFVDCQAHGRRVAREADEIHAKAVELRHPQIVAEALLNRLTGQVSQWTDLLVLAATAEDPPPPIETVRPALDRDAAEARRLFDLTGSFHDMLRVQMLTADIADLADEAHNAHQIANDVLGQAEAMLYEDICEFARDHLNDSSLYRKLLGQLETSKTIDWDVAMAGDSDERLNDRIDYTMQTLRLGPEFRPVIRDDAIASRKSPGSVSATAVILIYLLTERTSCHPRSCTRVILTVASVAFVMALTQTF